MFGRLFTADFSLERHPRGIFQNLVFVFLFFFLIGFFFLRIEIEGLMRQKSIFGIGP